MKETEEGEGIATNAATATATTTSSSSSPSSVCPYAAALNWNSDSDSVTTTASTNTPSDFVSSIPHSLRSIHPPDPTPTTTTTTTTTTKQMIQSCPAFSNGHCPFATCTNEHEIRKMLLQIPSSHYHHQQPEDETNHPNEDHPTTPDVLDDSAAAAAATTPFLKVLQDLHAVAGTIATTTTTTSSTTTTTNSTLTAIPIPSKCPVFHATSTKSTTTTTTSSKFTHVIMDGYSLSEIMARLAKQMEEEEEQEDNVHTDTTGPLRTGTTTASEDTVTKVSSTDRDTTMSGGSEENHPPTEIKKEQTSLAPIESSTVMTEDVAASSKLLSATMKSGTAASHVAAENVYFVRNFIRGQIDPTLFAALTKQLFYVYRTLEYHLLAPMDTDDRSNRVHVQQFYKFHQALQRTESLKEDLDYWFGTKEAEEMIQYQISDTDDVHSTADHTFISPATRDYIRRIQYCAHHNPYLLLAHSYTRYLGDLSGGKILARVARKALQLSSTDDGLAFYDFAATITNTKQFKDDYRLALDQLDPSLTNEQIQCLVAEANIAFVLNMRIFEELDVLANIPNATVRPYDEAILPYVIIPGRPTPTEVVDTPTNRPNKDIPKECPFAKMNAVATSDHEIHHHSTKRSTKNGPHARCPWPFVLFHDPKQFMYDWQTWMTFGLLLCWLYHQFVVIRTTVA